MSGIPFIISGPSGAGKTTLYKKAVGTIDGLMHSVSYTTRGPRPGDVDGADYRFVDDAAFDHMIERGEFIEYAVIHGRRYGTSRADLDAMLDAGLDVILEIDIQGAESLKKTTDGGVYIFIAPPSVEACRKRLAARGKDAPEEIEKRLDVALEEISMAPQYDYIIINEEVKPSFERLKAIITAERSRSKRVIDRVHELFGEGWKKGSP